MEHSPDESRRLPGLVYAALLAGALLGLRLLAEATWIEAFMVAGGLTELTSRWWESSRRTTAAERLVLVALSVALIGASVLLLVL